MLLKKQDISSPLSSTHYVMLHPQNGDRIVAIDSVTSLHPVSTVTWLTVRWQAAHRCHEEMTVGRSWAWSGRGCWRWLWWRPPCSTTAPAATRCAGGRQRRRHELPSPPPPSPRAETAESASWNLPLRPAQPGDRVLAELLCDCRPHCPLCRQTSSLSNAEHTQRHIAFPCTRTTLGDRSFAVAGPRVWNSLPAILYDRSAATDSLGNIWKHIYRSALWLSIIVRYINTPTYLLTYLITAIKLNRKLWTQVLSTSMSAYTPPNYVKLYFNPPPIQ